MADTFSATTTSLNPLGATSFSNEYLLQQSQQSMQMALLQAQQLGNQAAQVKNQVSQSAAQAAQQKAQANLNYSDALARQKEYVKSQYQAEQYKQDAISNQYDIMLQNITNLTKSMTVDAQTNTNIMYAQAGALKADAAGRGIVAGTSGNQEEINFMVQETTKTANNQQKRSINEINDAANKALSLQVEKAFSKWNLDTQINFSNMIIRDGAY